MLGCCCCDGGCGGDFLRLLIKRTAIPSAASKHAAPTTPTPIPALAPVERPDDTAVVDVLLGVPVELELGEATELVVDTMPEFGACVAEEVGDVAALSVDGAGVWCGST